MGYLPYNYLLFTDTREPLVEVAAQLLCITLDNQFNPSNEQMSSPGEDCPNLFINYLSRIHRDEVRNSFGNDRSSGLLGFLCRILVFY